MSGTGVIGQEEHCVKGSSEQVGMICRKKNKYQEQEKADLWSTGKGTTWLHRDPVEAKTKVPQISLDNRTGAH